MLHLPYVGIAFAVVFYVVFGIAVRLMDLSDSDRNRARLSIIVVSLTSFMISTLLGGFIRFHENAFFHGAVFIVLSSCALVILSAIFIELHNIKKRVKIRRFMVLFDIVERFLNEGKTKEEIINYLIDIQKLTIKEATDFMDFISDPTNYKFLADVNAKIHEAQILRNTRK